MDSPKKIVEAIFAELAFVASSYFGAQHVDRNHKPPNYVWIPDGIFPDMPESGGDEPAQLRLAGHLYQVQIYAKTYDDAVAMYAALLEATDRMVEGARWQVGAADWAHNEDDNRGWLLVAPATLTLPLPSVVYPTEETSDSPSDSVVEKTSAEVQIDDFEPDASGAESGDGATNAGEE